jgi:hypothetical protein
MKVAMLLQATAAALAAVEYMQQRGMLPPLAIQP